MLFRSLDKKLFDALDHDMKYNDDFLQWKSDVKYNLIIGNPPYVFDKRTNVFTEFIEKSIIEHLDHDGVLAFVIPTSFNNSMVYNNTRNLIKSSCSILDIKILMMVDI